MDACAANLGDEPKLKGWIRENRLRPTDPGFSQKVLQGQPGEVWSATSQVGDFLVVVGSPYRCAVWARRERRKMTHDLRRRVRHHRQVMCH